MREDLLPTTFEGKVSRVVEESGEVLHVVGKLQRYGLKPTDHATGIEYDNGKALKEELIQLHHALCELLSCEELE